MTTSTHRGPVAASLLLALLGSMPVFAQDHADIDRTQITGNRELPKVTYIVPWKKPLPGDNAGRPVASVLDEALAPIDRDVFRRQVRYGALVQAQANAATSVGAPTTSTTPSRPGATAAAPVTAPAPGTTK